ncbi:3-dehydroquinate dehydratase [uncultured archaeon]|nr:3-dehydroquinate dehydratase [uncultured archaeon]
MICVTLTQRTPEEMVKAAAESNADLVEVRLDYLDEAADLTPLAQIKKPVIATCMASWEGGHFKGHDDHRFQILTKALEYSKFITVELRGNPRLRDGLIAAAKNAKVKVIIAHHDFEGTPDLRGVLEILKHEQSLGADIAKVAFTPKSMEDVLTVIDSIPKSRLPIPVIAISMGELGRISRIAGVLFGGFLTYASPDGSEPAVVGQMTVSETRKIMEAIRPRNA